MQPLFAKNFHSFYNYVSSNFYILSYNCLHYLYSLQFCINSWKFCRTRPFNRVSLGKSHHLPATFAGSCMLRLYTYVSGVKPFHPCSFNTRSIRVISDVWQATCTKHCVTCSTINVAPFRDGQLELVRGMYWIHQCIDCNYVSTLRKYWKILVCSLSMSNI